MRAPPASIAIGPLSATLRCPTATLAPCPSPAPSLPRGAARNPSPTLPHHYKSLRGQPSPLFHPRITSSSARLHTVPHLAPSTSCQPRPTRPPLPPPVLSLPPPSSPPCSERHPRSPSGQVAKPLTFLSSPSCSRTPPPPPMITGAPLRR
jgi:hypothetical protein